MKKQGAVVAIAGLLSLFSLVAFADASSSERDFEKAIQQNIEQKNAIDANKYNQLAALAGDKSDELAAKKDATVKTYNDWRELKSAAEASNSDTAIAKAIEAGEKHAQANKEFVELQKSILLKSSDSVTVVEAINALNATVPTAAGR
ncbi:MAG: hypothetical protein ACOY9D_09785 [Pseudomonadota bacterium]